MSPPIRDGSGNSIGAIRLGDGTEISEVRTGAGDVLFSAIPDSLVSRTADNANTDGGGADSGMIVTTTNEWSTIQARISSNTTSDASQAKILELDDGNNVVATIANVDISALDSGDVVTFEESDLSSDLKTSARYAFVISNFTKVGFFNSPSYPKDSDDGVITLENGIFVGSGTVDRYLSYSEIGNINL